MNTASLRHFWVCTAGFLIACGADSADEFTFPDDMCPGVAANADLVMCTVRTETALTTDPEYALAGASTYDEWGMRSSSVFSGVVAYEAERDERGRLIREEQNGSFGWQTLTFGWSGCDSGTRRFQDDTADASGPFTWRNGVVDSWTMTNTVPNEWGTQEFQTSWEDDNIVYLRQTLDNQTLLESSYVYEDVDNGVRVTEDRSYGGVGSVSERFVRQYDDAGRLVLYEHDRNADGVMDSRRTVTFTGTRSVEETDGDADGVVDWSVVRDTDDVGRILTEHMMWTDESGPQERRLELTWDCP